MAAVSYKCPNCGGGLAFDPATQKFKCEYCISLYAEDELEKLAAAEAARNATQEEPAAPPPAEGTAEDNDEFERHAVIYSCPSCGAEVVCDETTAATFCYYCHNPVVLAGRLAGTLKPDKVIPFAIEKELAIQKFLEWTGKKLFIPRAFFSGKQIEKISGIYFPYWFVDCEMEAVLQTTASDVRVWRSGDTEYTETKKYRVERGGSAAFTDISHLALNKADKRLVEGILPFDSSKMLDFSMSYLSGFQAEKRDIESAELSQQVCNEAGGYTQTLLRDTISHGSVSSGTYSAQMKRSKWRYVLLPVWVLTYKSGGKVYYYAMNGQTGNVCGILPLDWKRLAVLAAGIALPLFGLLTLGGYLL